MSSLFGPRNQSDILALVQGYPLAWVVSREHNAPATPLPLLAECDGDGRIVSLFGHFARRNPQVEALQASPKALILFQGPQGYISGRLVSKEKWGPTWNYAVARFDVHIEFVPNEIDDALRALAAHLEAGQAEPWTVERMDERYKDLQQHIIAFRAHVEHVDATFKLGQDETRETFEEIVAGHGNKELTKLMRRLRDG